MTLNYSEYTLSKEYESTWRRLQTMKKNWTCPRCLLVFSRKWNFERHFKLMHLQDDQLGILDSRFREGNESPKLSSSQPEGYSSSLKRTFSDMFEIGEMMNKMSTSSQTFGRMNTLQSQVGYLQQELSYFKNHMNELISRNWFMPLKSVQGFSGFICNKCQTFSLKPIFDIGYDMTMEFRHRCNEVPTKRNYYNFPFPSDVQDTENWAARILFDHLSRIVPIGKCIVVKDLTRAFSNLSIKFNPDEVRLLFGIPERYHLFSLENDQPRNWMERAISNAEKKILLSDAEALEFLKLFKSTYAIFQIPVQDTFKHMLLILTGY